MARWRGTETHGAAAGEADELLANGDSDGLHDLVGIRDARDRHLTAAEVTHQLEHKQRLDLDDHRLTTPPTTDRGPSRDVARAKRAHVLADDAPVASHDYAALSSGLPNERATAGAATPEADQ